jgi:hypothetical protein
MATAVSAPLARRGKRIDDFFFAGMSLLILGTVFLGFARSYFLAGTIYAHLPSAIIHAHGIVFSCWIVLFATQTALVSIGKVSLHRKLGVFGAVLAILIVLLGVMAIVDSTRRHFAPPGLTSGMFLALDLGEMTVFAFLVCCGIRARRDGATHKRLILLATIVMMFAPVSRWPFPVMARFPPMTGLIIDAFLLSIVVFDLLTRGRVHRATAWGSIAIFVLVPAMFALGHFPLWVHFTEWVQR